MEKSENWSYEFTDLDETDIDGQTYIYRVQEINVPLNYEASYSDNGLEITNTYIPPTGDLTADIEWVNGENVPKPGTTLSLKIESIDSDGNTIYTNAVDAEGNPIVGVVGEDGVVTFGNVPLTDGDGVPLSFTVTQTGLEDSLWVNDSISTITPYSSTGEIDPAQTNIRVVNRFIPETVELTADTEWIGGGEDSRPDTSLLLMVKDPVNASWIPAMDNDGNPIVGTANTDGVWIYPNVPLTGLDGTPLEYTVTQTSLENTLWFEQSITEIQPQQDDGMPGETNIHVINEYNPATIDLTADTTWINGDVLQKPSTVLSLKLKDPVTDEWIDATDLDGNPIVGQANDAGLWTFPNVPLTDKEGTPLTYTVTQRGLEATPWINDSITEITPGNPDQTIGESHILVTNSYRAPEVPITATNQWIGGPEIDSSTFVTYTLIRSVTVNGLTTTEEVLLDATPNADGSFTFGLQPTTDIIGNAYTYTIVQNFVDPEARSQYETVIASITPFVDPEDLTISIINTYIQSPTTTDPTTTQPSTTDPTRPTTAPTQPSSSSATGLPVARTGEHMTAPWIAAGAFLLAVILFLMRRFRREDDLDESGTR